MTARTVTYDPAVYKLVPVDPSNESCCILKQHADSYLSNIGAYRAMLAAVPADLPGVVVHSGEPVAILISDEGEPSGYVLVEKDAHPHIVDAVGGFPVFTHPAPDTAALQARIAELEAMVAAQAGEFGKLLAEQDADYVRKTNALIARNSKRIEELRAAQAGQEPIYQMRRIVGGEWVNTDADGETSLKRMPHWKGIFEFRTLYTAPPAPASLSLVQAALEAAAKVSETNAEFYAADTPSDIRAIDPQQIIDEVSK